MRLLTVNAAELDKEVRRAVPTVLLPMGATGDGGHLHARRQMDREPGAEVGDLALLIAVHPWRACAEIAWHQRCSVTPPRVSTPGRSGSPTK